MFPQRVAFSGTAGQKGETVRVPTALATCSGPVLLHTYTLIVSMTPANSRMASFPMEFQIRSHSRTEHGHFVSSCFSLAVPVIFPFTSP